MWPHPPLSTRLHAKASWGPSLPSSLKGSSAWSKSGSLEFKFTFAVFWRVGVCRCGRSASMGNHSDFSV